MTERTFTVEQLADLTQLSRRTIYRMVDSGELDAYRLAGRVRIPGAVVEAWLEANRVVPRRRERPAASTAARPGAVSNIRAELVGE